LMGPRPIGKDDRKNEMVKIMAPRVNKKGRLVAID